MGKKVIKIWWRPTYHYGKNPINQHIPISFSPRIIPSQKNGYPMSTRKRSKKEAATPVTHKNGLYAFRALSDDQNHYISTIRNNLITFGYGAAGTGRTYCAVGVGCQYLASQTFERIIITRPNIECGKELGYLPGTMHDKMHQYLLPIYDYFHDFFSYEEIATYQNGGCIQISPLNYMRGRTFRNSYVILDEAANCTYEQLKMFVTRIGENCKMAINGDVTQSDLPKAQQGALAFFIEKLTGLEGIGTVQLNTIVRHDLIGKILEKLDG